ncbi:MAG: hypothetical protein ACO22N_01980 [Ilumatobacteraceae bacterium]
MDLKKLASTSERNFDMFIMTDALKDAIGKMTATVQPQENPPPPPQSGGMFGMIVPLIMQVLKQQALQQKQSQAEDQKMVFLDDSKPYMNPNVQQGPAIAPMAMQMQNTAPVPFQQPAATGGAGRSASYQNSFAPSMNPVQRGNGSTFASGFANEPQSGWGSKVLLG